MITEDQKDKTIESAEVIVLDNLKTSNLPELIGWKEKQHRLVEDNPYVEIIDTKTYSEACKSRTNLLKGRTELQGQDKAVASKLASFRKEVASETSILIDITKPHEEKQDTEVKRWEGIKAKEKEEKENAEAKRIKAIQDKMEKFETDSYTIIQKITFESIKSDKERLSALRDDEFDFAEYDVVFDQVLDRVTLSLESKVKNLTDNENQRLHNLELEKENAEAKRVLALQSSRLTAIMPYIAFGVALDLTKLGEMDEAEFDGNLSSKKGLFEVDAEIKRKSNEERLAKEEEEKDAIYEIRAKRLIESGLIYSDEHESFWTELDKAFIILKYDIYNETALKFEDTLLEVKDVIEKSIKKAKEETFNARKNYLFLLGFAEDNLLGVFTLKDIWSVYYEQIEKLSDEEFQEYSESILSAMKEADKKAAKADAAKLKAENNARIKKFSSDKKELTKFVKSLDVREAVPELENKESEETLSTFFIALEDFRKEWINNIEII